jgi:hypothetical protein
VRVVEVFEGDIAYDAPMLVQGLVARGLQVEVVCPPAAASVFEGTGGKVIPLTVGGIGALAGLRRLLRGEPAGEQAADHVAHAHGLRAGVAVSLARTGGLPFVLTLADRVSGSRTAGLVGRAVIRAVFPAAAAVLAPTQDLVEAAQRLGAREVRLLEPVPPEPGPVAYSAEQVREELALPAGRPIVLAQARLHEDSRLDVLVGAATGWRRLAEVVLVGTGPAYRELVAQATIARAPVTFAGDRASFAPAGAQAQAGATLEDLLAAATVAVVTDPRARPELALRAARAGVALVVPTAGTVADLFGTEAVVTVPVGDVDALDEAVRALLAEDRAGLVARARARLASLPDAATVADELIGLYERVSLATPAERIGDVDTPAGPR